MSAAREVRALFRHMRALPSFQSQSSPLRKVVLEKVRSGSFTNTDKQSLKECAKGYSLMTASIKELNHLRELDTGEKLSPRDKIRATAGRVGLSVPFVSKDCFSYFPTKDAVAVLLLLLTTMLLLCPALLCVYVCDISRCAFFLHSEVRR